MILGASMVPLLPIDRVAATARAEETKGSVDDDTSCDYWKYCAVDGFLCSCCGGGSHDCPPGASPSPTSWSAPAVIRQMAATISFSYRDCCGKTSCGRCLCANTISEMPLYRPQLDSDLIWCFGAPTMSIIARRRKLSSQMSRRAW